MNIWGQIMPTPYPNGKVHISVVRDIVSKLDKPLTMEQIWHMVALRGISDDLDILATMRAIRAFQGLLLVLRKTPRLAITAK